MFSFLAPPDGRPQRPQQFCALQQPMSNQQIANSLTALLCQRAGISSDPLAAGSRSNSPFIRPAQDANNANGSQLDAVPAAMQLPAAALPPPSSTPIVTKAQQQQQLELHLMAAAAAQQQQQQPCGHSCSDCSHSSAHMHHDQAALATPPTVGLFVGVPRSASPVPMQLEQQQQPASLAAVPSAQQQADAVTNQAPGPAAAAAGWSAPVVPPAAACSSKAWLYQLVTCPFLFKPCPECSTSHSGREVLITYFDPDDPGHGYCTYCPERTLRPRLLQIRRSTYHEVVKAADVSRITDVSGIQHYVINGAKVLFLRPRPQPRPPKGVVAPARCAVDGRQLMDAHSSYCSLRCKLEVEDKIFAANYPSAMEEMEAAAADGEGGEGTSGSHLAGTYHRQGGHEGRRVVVPSSKRSATASLALSADHEDGSSEDGDADHKRAKRQRVLPSKYANALMGGTPTYAAAMAAISKPPGPQNLHHHHHDVGNGPLSHKHGHHHHNHHKAAGGYSGRDDTANDQLVGVFGHHAGGAAVAAGSLTMAGLAGLAHMAKGHHHAADSPCNSDDSGRSTTCNQRWHHKRKVMQPHRAPLQ